MGQLYNHPTEYTNFSLCSIAKCAQHKCFMWAIRGVPGWKQVEVMTDIKDAFLTQDALAVVVALVGPPLMRHAERQMTDRDVLVVQLVITFLRNLIVIPDCSVTSGAHGRREGMAGGWLKPLSRMEAKYACASAQALAAATGAQCAANSCSNYSQTARWSSCLSWHNTPRTYVILTSVL